MKNYYNLILIFSASILILLFSSCDKDEPVAPQLKGTLIGWVTLTDEFGRIPTDKGDAIVTIDGTIPQITATTDSTGKYQIDNLPEGTYDVIFSKNSYATTKTIGMVFLGGDKPKIQSTTLSQPSTTLISDITTIEDSSKKYVNLQGSISSNAPNEFNFFIRYFMSSIENVSNINYQSTSLISVNAGVNKLNGGIGLDKHKFPPGTLVYIIAYGETVSDAGYVDSTTGLNIYPALNPQGSNVASFVMP
jgi:hypothetical protein